MVIYQYPLHFEVRLFAILLIFELDESVLQAVAGSFISDHFARYYFAKTTED